MRVDAMAICTLIARFPMFLPPVPNLAWLVFWLRDVFCGIPSCVEQNKYIVQTREFKACNAPKGFELLVQPPSKFLPALSEVDEDESRHRFDYWCSFLCCCPVLMGMLCEFICVCAKITTQNSDMRIGKVERAPTSGSLTDKTLYSRLSGKTDCRRFSWMFPMYQICRLCCSCGILQRLGHHQGWGFFFRGI